ncbi:MAG TPA: VanZ family protein [Vicinamibacteria bacterium]
MARRAASRSADAVRYWGPVVLYMGLIFWASSQPRIALPLPTSDYVLHGAGYAVLAVLSVRALASSAFRGLTIAQVAGGIAIAAVYGLTDEWHQLHVPGRDASLLDALADFVGASLGGSVLMAFSALSLRRGDPRWL